MQPSSVKGVSQHPLWKQISLPRLAGVSALSVFLLLMVFQIFVKEHPYVRYSTRWNPTAFLPPSAELNTSKGEWSIQAFFYSIGAWPVQFDKKPVFFVLPYEKGPPSQFIGRIHARWEMPEIQMTWEGPKTPQLFGEVIPLQALEDCFSETSAYFSLGCFRKRKSVLSRHISEITTALKRGNNSATIQWDLKWFEIENPLLPLSERPKGIYLSGATVGSLTADRAQDRVILVLPNGIQQSLILQRPVNPRGDLAKILFEHSVRSLRMFPRLDEGRLWAAQELRSIDLKKLEQHPKSPFDLASQISRIQLRLLSKLSVDPANRSAYFHLGGTSGLLAKTIKFSQKTDRTLAEVIPENQSHDKTEAALEMELGKSIDPNSWIEESAATARPNAMSALSYSRDLAGDDPEIKQLITITEELKKF